MSQDRGTYKTDINEAVEMLGKGYNDDPIQPTEFVSTVSGFTLAPDAIIAEHGYITALVWGVVWRYCQMSDGVCRASLDKLANRLGMSSRTLTRHIDKLCNGGYLFDITPDLKNKPHIYADAGKIKVRMNLSAMTESHSAMTESHRHYDRESLEESIKKQTKKQKESTTMTVPNIFEIYEKNIGIITPMIADILKDAEKDYPGDWLTDAIALAVSNNKRNWKYCEAILKRWKVDGKDDGTKPQTVRKTKSNKSAIEEVMSVFK